MADFKNTGFEQKDLLVKNIVSAIAFFDIFEYPLTLIEVWKNMYNFKLGFIQKNYNINDVLNLLDKLILKKKLGSKKGFYFIYGRDDLVQRRLDRHIPSKKRWEKMIKIVKILRIVPFVKMIAVCNMFAIGAASKKSDIDLFIVAKSGRIWITRLLVTILVFLTGQWRHRRSIAGKICLSFFVTEDYLNLERIAKKPSDPYLNYWITLVWPVYTRDKTHMRFVSANKWVKKFIPNFLYFKPSSMRLVKPNFFTCRLQSFGERILSSKFGDKVEAFVKKQQIKYMHRDRESASRRQDTDVLICDKILKFHEVDNRMKYKEMFEREVLKVV